MIGPSTAEALGMPKRGRAKRGEAAIRSDVQARAHDALADEARKRGDGVEEYMERSHARYERAEAQALMAPTSETGRLVQGCGEALVDDRGADGRTETVPWQLVDTLEHPSSISVEASQRRIHLASGADALEPAIDAAMSAEAGNSIEKMLCHQLAALHVHAMKHLERSNADRLPAVEQCRYTNAAARLMDAFQNGVLALRRFRVGSTQTVQVVHVGDGGQAVVAGRMSRGGSGGGRAAE